MGEVTLTSTAVEAHAEEEWVRGMNLDSGVQVAWTSTVKAVGATWRRSGQQGASVEAVGVASWPTRRRSGRRWVCDGKIIVARVRI
jgi:hypothetical protein